jgi:hypothetical protein
MTDVEGIIRAAGDTCQMARAQGCALDIEIKRNWFGGLIRVQITPSLFIKPTTAITIDGQKVGEAAQLPAAEE